MAIPQTFTTASRGRWWPRPQSPRHHKPTDNNDPALELQLHWQHVVTTSLLTKIPDGGWPKKHFLTQQSLPHFRLREDDPKPRSSCNILKWILDGSYLKKNPDGPFETTKNYTKQWHTISRIRGTEYSFKKQGWKSPVPKNSFWPNVDLSESLLQATTPRLFIPL